MMELIVYKFIRNIFLIALFSSMPFVLISYLNDSIDLTLFFAFLTLFFCITQLYIACKIFDMENKLTKEQKGKLLKS